MTTTFRRILLSALTILPALIFFENISIAQSKPAIVYTDADIFPVYGKVSPETSARYERLPAEFNGVIRTPVWNLGRNSAGLYIRFRSNSTSIHARWESTTNHEMNHMTPTGSRGLDLYALYDGQWRFVRSGRPQGKVTDTPIIENMAPQMREYMLYLSLYDGVSSLEIGVDEGSVLEQSMVYTPSIEKAVIMYGTSILQGGCASRPGMAFTNILSRKLDREVVNLGFSGNALLDYEIAQWMTMRAHPGVYVLDYVPNASAQQINERGEKFFRILRDAHPEVPVIFIEDPIFPFSLFDQKIANEIQQKNAAQKALFDKLKNAGEKRIYYISSQKMIGTDGEATVDGIHFTDLGMTRYADYVLPTIRKALKANR